MTKSRRIRRQKKRNKQEGRKILMIGIAITIVMVLLLYLLSRNSF